ncbi:MmcQ/YjbR family DNA-binding protein [Wenxinia saemankumensis]|uniref:Predicted DNA-binding protein, MmcQ/YjbR family n=1 Tax=Wenxinia saemankumensis TaxID=1447782 RepID=A0A1M5ZZ86_9RHOB|nr:MmcQ/YjbR family DNA-binding protein [Wenxinia saemankumensis]SHI29532.1 Predicted DNA-binding protein, MmcQ/YjbR family [Wenxinia saemankumensis]
MSRDAVNAICRVLPGAEWSDPWGGGHDAWKVGGKLFAVIGAAGAAVAVKCASVDEAEHLMDLFGWRKAAYFHRSWVEMPLGTEADLLRHRLEASHATILAGLPRKVRTALEAGRDAAAPPGPGQA